MRLTLLLALTCFAAAVAGDNFPVVLLDIKDGHDQHVQFRTDTNTLWSMPRWTMFGTGRDDDDPPLSMLGATRIARDAGKRRAPEADDVMFNFTKLQRFSFEYPGGTVITWFYEFSAWPIIPEGSVGARRGPEMTIVVLLDGTVLEPVVVK